MDALEPFSVSLGIVIRPCRLEDLPALEWFGLFASQRQLIEIEYGRHEAGEAVILVADANGEVSAQAWIDLARADSDSTAVVWAVRVMPCLQNLGIGTRMLAAAEDVARERRLRFCELSVDRDNERAARLYERLGYELVGADPLGQQWIMRKTLTDSPASRRIGQCEAT